MKSPSKTDEISRAFLFGRDGTTARLISIFGEKQREQAGKQESRRPSRRRAPSKTSFLLREIHSLNPNCVQEKSRPHATSFAFARSFIPGPKVNDDESRLGRRLSCAARQPEARRAPFPKRERLPREARLEGHHISRFDSLLFAKTN